MLEETESFWPDEDIPEEYLTPTLTSADLAEMQDFLSQHDDPYELTVTIYECGLKDGLTWALSTEDTLLWAIVSEDWRRFGPSLCAVFVKLFNDYEARTADITRRKRCFPVSVMKSWLFDHYKAGWLSSIKERWRDIESKRRI